MIQLAYLSSVAALLDSEEISRILVKSRENNIKRGITGMLLYKGGNVLQILENSPDVVHQLFDVIQNDKRNGGVLKIYEKTVTQRDFPEWQMGFHDLNADQEKKMEGYSEFLKDDFDIKSLKPSAAAKLLGVFKSGVR